MSKQLELPFDFARCSPVECGCPCRDTCARFTSKWRSGVQTSMDASSMIKKGHDSCDMFISNDKEDYIDCGKSE